MGTLGRVPYNFISKAHENWTIHLKIPINYLRASMIALWDTGTILPPIRKAFLQLTDEMKVSQTLASCFILL